MTTDGANIPEYLSEDLFRDALNDTFKSKNVTVKSLNLKLISEGGENYCSDIYRATVEYTTHGNKIKKIVLIVKDMKACFTQIAQGQPKEIDMYTQMVPKMEEILGEEGILAPKCFLATTDYNELYIFQDLEDLGYTVQDRLKGFNEEQAHMFLKKIAEFHAASMVVAKKDPELMESVGRPAFEGDIENIPIAAELIFGNLEYVTQLAKEWEGFEEIAIKLQRLRSTYSSKFLETTNSSQIRFKVLNHGDLWVNNMMFKHDNGTCVDARLIDLQICCYGSPGLDLHNSFTTSIPLDIAVMKKYDLLRSYHNSLKATLLKLNYSPIPTWDDLLNELRVTEFFALQSAMVAMPLIFLEKSASKGNDLDTLNDPNLMKKKRVHMFKSERTLATTRYILDRMNDLGVLD